MKNTSPLIQDDETEESVSLTNSPTVRSSPQFTSEPTELFEFYSSSNNTLPQRMMSHAEDIIFCGKLITLKQQESHDEPRDQKKDCDDVINVVKSEKEERETVGNVHRLKFATQPNSPRNFGNVTNAVRRDDEERGGAGSGRRLYATQPNSPRSKKYMMMRNSKSLDYEHLRRSLSSDCRGAGIRRYSSTRSSDRYDTSGQKVKKPRWYSMLFGLVSKTPPETMELKDMKNRLVRRTPSTMFQSESTTLYPTAHNQRKSSWGLLSVLSCKDETSIGVTNSFGCMPQVNSCDDIYSRVSCT